jgi:HD-GYP domain-containing protein (c-di-GMP phosphodiesterase class II)
MEAQPALQLCHLTADMLASPIPFDLFNSRGALLVRKGTQLRDNAGFLLAQALYRPRDAEDDLQSQMQQLEDLYAHYGKLMDAWSGRGQDFLDLRQLAGNLVHLCGGYSDLCVAMASHLDGRNNAVRHSFATAIVAILIASTLGWNLRRQHTLARAGLTMDLSLLSIEDEKGDARPLDEDEADAARKHPERSATMLLQSACVDNEWFAAVDQHHENLDGTGYPVGLKGSDICREARVLRVADAWCNAVLLPSGQSKKTPRDAIQAMRRYIGIRFDPRIFQALKQLMGAYPPGTFVRLANRETAIVMRWDRHGALPKYATSVLTPSGDAAREFKVRPLTERSFGIRNYTYLDMAQMARFSLSRIWAAGAI